MSDKATRRKWALWIAGALIAAGIIHSAATQGMQWWNDRETGQQAQAQTTATDIPTPNELCEEWKNEWVKLPPASEYHLTQGEVWVIPIGDRGGWSQWITAEPGGYWWASTHAGVVQDETYKKYEYTPLTMIDLSSRDRLRWKGKGCILLTTKSHFEKANRKAQISYQRHR